MERQVSNLGLNCVALYKVAKIKGKPLPDEKVHVYLAGLVERFEHPSFFFSKFVVNSVEELNEKVLQSQSDVQPNAVPYLVAKYSGDYSTNYNAHLPLTIDSYFPSACYSVAQYHSGKMGKREEARIFGLLALDPERYISLLSNYYSYLKKEKELEITDEDYISFRKELCEGFNDPQMVSVIKKVKNTSTNKLLI